MFKQHEAVDGITMNVQFPLGNQFQLGGAWTLSNSKGASFELMTVVNNHSGNPYQGQDEVQSAVFRFNSDTTGMVMGNFNLPYKISCQTQTMFNDSECKEIVNLMTLQRDFRDCSLSLRF